MANVYLVNDCFRWSDTVVHCGCKAIMDSLKKRITDAGHEIIAVCPRPQGPIQENLEKCDWVIMNGEGTFRDEDKNFEPGRHDRLFDGLTLAKKMGKRVYLMNAVWCRMSNRWAPVLDSMDGISTREPQSAEEIRKLCGRTPEVHPDESYFRWLIPYDRSKNHGIVIGDFYENAKGVSRESMMDVSSDYSGLLSYTWSQVVSYIRGVHVYATGQHHGVYAACKARTPFAACRVNTHKLTSLFDWAGVHIPLASNMAEMKDAIDFACTHQDEFIKLFNFLERQSPWPIPVS